MNDKQKTELFDHICHAYRRELQNFIFLLSRKDSFITDDLYQNTMMNVYRNLNKLKDSKKVRSWIFSIAENEVKRYYYKNRKYYNFEINEPEEDWPMAVDREDFTEFAVDNNLIVQLLNELSEESQVIILLHYYYDYSFAKISELTGVNESTARSRHRRGLMHMRVALQGKL